MDHTADRHEHPEVHDPRDDEQPFVRWAPLYIPLFAAALAVFMILILNLS